MQKKPSKLTVLSLIFFFIFAPLSIYAGSLLAAKNNYYLASILIIILAIIPFFVYFENRKVKTAEIVIFSMMTALSVGARSVMMFVPQVKPTAALVIVTAVAFGPNVGFLTGALSMFLSNFIFGQGMFTPFQMLGMGLVGFFAGIFFYNKKKISNRWVISITGGILTFALYGIIADSCSVFMLLSNVTLKSAASVYLSGLTFNIIHGITTAVMLFFISKPMNDKFSRLRKKYGIFDT